jgi:hypothetical protein
MATETKLKAGVLGIVGVAVMGAVMMSPALGIYGNFGPMALTAGKTTPLVFLLALLATLPTAINYAMISKEIPSSGSAYTWLWEEMIRQRVLHSQVIGTDETGVKINGKNHWFWTGQNNRATFIAPSNQQGNNHDC